MNFNKIIRAVVGSGRYTETAAITKEDYGRILKIEGIELPETYEIDFSNDRKEGTSVTMIGNADGVLIPRQFIKSGKDIYAFYYHVGEDFGKTTYIFHIPNRVRPDRTNEQPEPEQQSVIDQAISALNTAVAQTAQDVIDADASANSAAESASSAAQSAESTARLVDDVEEYVEAAEQFAGSAAMSATTASAAETSASASAQSAYADAERAEQAAAQSGYLWFYIESGKLYMDRTENTQVDFFMRDGKLYVEEIA